MRQGTSKEAAEFVSCWHLLLGKEPTLKGSLFPQGDSPLEKTKFHLQVLSNWRLSPGEGWKRVPTSLWKLQSPPNSIFQFIQ